MTTVLADTHVVHWWSSEPDLLSPRAAATLDGADEVAVAAITWYELAWMAHHARVHLQIPLRRWLADLSTRLRTVSVTPEIADTAVRLPVSFPGDGADRLIYATAVENGWSLISRDRGIRAHAGAGELVVW